MQKYETQNNKHDFLKMRSPIKQPYKYVFGGGFTDPEESCSPDPLVSYRWKAPKADDDLQIFVRRPISVQTETPMSFDGLESAAEDKTYITVNGAGMFMMDFGREFAGWLEIDSPDLSGEIKLGTSEYSKPAFVNVGAQCTDKTQIPKRYDNTYRLELNDELYEGVRYGFVNVNALKKPFHITDIRLICQTKPTNYNGSFNCDNEQLNRIWYTAAYDVKANLKKDYFAAILNDRGDRFSWTGDAYPSQAAALVAFANYDFVLKNLKYTSTRGNGIESYELYWIFSLANYYRYTKDNIGVNCLLDQAISRLEHAYDIYGKPINLEYFGWDERLGAGFENPNTEQNYESYKMLSIRAWKKFSEVLENIGENTLAVKYRNYAREKINEFDSGWYNTYQLHAAADAINAGVIPNHKIEEFYNKCFKDRANRLSYSPFNQYFILQAMSASGNYDDAIAAILDMYGGQIEYGGTMFFEVYRPQWNDGLETNGPVPNNQAGYTSLAHPWGAGVLSWISEELLGIKPKKAGFEMFSVTPHLGRQLTRVSGKMPTPHGIINASFDVLKGAASLTVPDGTIADIGIPKAEKGINNIKMNGNIADIVSQDNDFLYINGLTAGEYTFEISYFGSTPKFKDIEYDYAADFIGAVKKSDKSFGEIYGADGCFLCAYDPNDRISLPKYVSDVRFRLAKSVNWSVDTDDERALQYDDVSKTKRKIGAYHTDGRQPCAQSFTVDIDIAKPGAEYTVALYFVDWDRQGRQMAVDMFDGNTYDMIAPTQVIKNCENGVYLVYKYTDSVRFRINQMRGEDAVLSGIFFGERR